MASRFSLSSFQGLPNLGFSESELARRIELAREDRPEDEQRRPRLTRLAGELSIFGVVARAAVKKLEVPKTARPRTIMILPGFGTGPSRMRYMARQLEKAGHTAKRWGLGINFGPSEESFEALQERLLDLHNRSGEPVVLLGWSLGGIFARELAKRHPDAVAKVITMGSPFSGSPRDNNVWRVYQFITGHAVDNPPIEAEVAAKPPVETVAFWSPNDGAIAPRCAAGSPGERDRAVALRCTHIGFAYAPEAIHAVLKEIERG